jgi:hypothetical protein
MGEVVKFPFKPEARWGAVRRVYGEIIMEPYSHMIDGDDFMDRLDDESEDGETISVETFLSVCEDFNIGSDTSAEILVRLREHKIMLFTE